MGAAPFEGDVGNQALDAPIVGMASTPDHRGYWLFASEGGVFSFGDAHFCGSVGGEHLKAPVLAAMFDPTGGYWLVSSSGTAVPFGASPLPAPPAGVTASGAALSTA